MPKSNGVYAVKEAEAPEPIPVGVYPAKLTYWEERDTGKFGPFVRLEFEITKGDCAGSKRSLVASAKLTKGKNSETTSKLFKAISVLLGREPRPDEEVSLKELLGVGCQILVEDKQGDDNGWQNVSKLMPAKTKKAQN